MAFVATCQEIPGLSTRNCIRNVNKEINLIKERAASGVIDVVNSGNSYNVGGVRELRQNAEFERSAVGRPHS
ncbi:unnamed protein product [Ceratitis capitata]|uniref:(Mediterranean fruit fly) hypothetical protein n=1 Tax=Ceratitis capitata TaxID=7213 RepID=A0A811V6L6_CERCA|nr:unnamed protein product [Ceratitis capitata]